MRRYVYLVRAEPVDAAGNVQPQYWSCGQTRGQSYAGIEWINCLLSASGPGNQPYGPYSFSQEIPLDAQVGGKSPVGFGDLFLDMNFITLWALVALQFDGRPLTIWRVIEGASFALTDFPMLRGTTDQPTFGVDQTRIPLHDSSVRCDAPMQPNVYLGTGGYEGGPDLKGVRKPLVLGKVSHLEPIALDHAAPDANGQPFARVFQFNDGPVPSFRVTSGGNVPVTFVYEKGLQFANVSLISDVYGWTLIPSDAGKVVIDASRGVGRAGSTPQGTFTVSTEAGDVPIVSSLKQYTHGNIAKLALLRNATFTTAEIDQLSIDTLNAEIAAYPGVIDYEVVGIYIQDDRSIATVLDTIAQSCGAWWSFTASGLFQIRRVAFRDPVDSVGEKDIVTEDDLGPLQFPLPLWRYRYGCQPVERALSDTDIGGAAVIPSVRAYLAEPFRQSIHESATVKSRRLLARESSTMGRMDDRNAADFEGERQFRLLRHDRETYQCTVRRPYATFTAGDCVEIAHHAFGLSGGKEFLIRALTERPSLIEGEDAATLTLWGPWDPAEDAKI